MLESKAGQKRFRQSTHKLNNLKKPTQFDRHHLAKLIELNDLVSADALHVWRGRNLMLWWKSLFGASRSRLPDGPVSRTDLKQMCANVQHSSRECFAAVMAWGGMRTGHGRAAAKSLRAICRIVDDLRSGRLHRQAAFDRFSKLRMSGFAEGMGPAYFTKLIFFCDPAHHGYIMDQWTSKSVNMLTGGPVVDLTYSGFVSDHNDGAAYARFCNAIERLSEITSWKPEETEMRLFSSGGRTKGPWRAYVVGNYVRA